jgi:hypothetical protein
MTKKLQPYLIIILCILMLAVTANAQTIPLWGRWEQGFSAITTATPETELTV